MYRLIVIVQTHQFKAFKVSVLEKEFQVCLMIVTIDLLLLSHTMFHIRNLFMWSKDVNHCTIENVKMAV